MRARTAASRVAALVLPALLLLSACQSGQAAPIKNEEAPKQTKLGDLTFNDKGTTDVKVKDAIELEANNYYFEPTFVHGTPGKKLKLEIENESGTEHNITVVGQNVDKNIPAKGKIDVDVTIPNSGALRFYCKFHASLGMNGELLAGDAQPQAVSPSAQGGAAGAAGASTPAAAGRSGSGY